MSQTKLDKLTAEQEAELVAFREKWLRIGTSTEPADRPRAEAALTAMYAEIGEPAPVFWWCDSPWQARAIISLLPELKGANLRANLWDNLWDNLGANLGPNLRANLDTTKYTEWYWGAHDSAWVAYYLFSTCLTKNAKPDDLRKLNLHAELCQSALWVSSFKGICFVSDRPEHYSLELTPGRTPEVYRLHDASAPAMRFRDSYSLYAWHGTRVPEKVILSPETLTAKDILEEPNAEVARIMLERMGMERFCFESQPEVLDEDTDAGGRRRLLKIPNPHVSAGAMTMFNCICPSTGREYMLPVHPETKTCRSAAAWMVGLKAEEYAPAIER